MRRFVSVSIVAALLMMSAFAASAEKRGPSTPEERRRALVVIKELEAHPMSAKLAKDREWVFQWLQDIPDVKVGICTGVIGPLLAEKRSDARNAITLQHLLSSAAFQMENPDERDGVVIYTAASEGMLRAYENVLKQEPEYRSPFLEDLRAKKSSGALETYVRSGLDQCRRNAKLMKPPSAIGKDMNN
jgi:hypothetical protein